MSLQITAGLPSLKGFVMFTAIEMVELGRDLQGTAVSVPRLGSITVAEHIALADLELSLKSLFEAKPNLTQREFDYRRGLEFYRARASIEEPFEILANRLTHTQGQRLVELLAEELAGIPPAEGEDDADPQSLSGSSTSEPIGDSLTGSPDDSTPVVLVPSG